MTTKESFGTKLKKALIGGIAIVLIVGFTVKIFQYIGEITSPLARLLQRYIGDIFGLEAVVGLLVIITAGFSMDFIGRILPIPILKHIKKIRETVDRVSDKGQSGSRLGTQQALGLYRLEHH